MQYNKNIIIWWIVLIWGIIITLLLLKNSGQPHKDTQDELCRGKNITSIEYNIDTKECFETQISACNTPSFSSIEECKKINQIQ